MLNKKIPAVVGILIIFIFAGMVGVSALLFSKNMTEKDEKEIAVECQANIIPDIQGSTYSDARTKIISSGWSPLQTIDEEKLFGSERIFWKYGYKEIHACAGTGDSPCIFFFKDDCLNHLKVNTIGEEYPEKDAYAMIFDATILSEEEFNDFIIY